MKNILRMTFAAAFAVVSGYGIYVNHHKANTMPDWMLANVEALASDELTPNGCIPGEGGCVYDGIYSPYWVEYYWDDQEK